MQSSFIYDLGTTRCNIFFISFLFLAATMKDCLMLQHTFFEIQEAFFLSQTKAH